MASSWLTMSRQFADPAATAAWMRKLAAVHACIAARDSGAARTLLCDLRRAQSTLQASLQRYQQLGESLDTLQELARKLAPISDAQWSAWEALFSRLGDVAPSTLIAVPVELNASPIAAGPILFNVEAGLSLQVELNARPPAGASPGAYLRIGISGSCSLSAGASIPWVSGVFGGRFGISNSDSGRIEFDLWTAHDADGPALLALATALEMLPDPFSLAAVGALPRGSSLSLAGSGSMEVDINATVSALVEPANLSVASLGLQASKRIAGAVSIKASINDAGIVTVEAYRDRGTLTTQSLTAEAGLSLSTLGQGLIAQLSAEFGELPGLFDHAADITNPGQALREKLKQAIERRRADAVDEPWISRAEQRLKAQGGAGRPLDAQLASLLDSSRELFDPEVARAAATAVSRLDADLRHQGGLPAGLQQQLRQNLQEGIDAWRTRLQDNLGRLDPARRQKLLQLLKAAGLPGANPYAELLALQSTLRDHLRATLDSLHFMADAAIELKIEHSAQQGAESQACIALDIDSRAALAPGELADAYRAAACGNFSALQQLAAKGPGPGVSSIRGTLSDILTQQTASSTSLALLNMTLLEQSLFRSETQVNRSLDGTVELLSQASLQRRVSLFGATQTDRCVDLFALRAAAQHPDIRFALTVSQQNDHLQRSDLQNFAGGLEAAALIPPGSTAALVALYGQPRGAGLLSQGELSALLAVTAADIDVLLTVDANRVCQTAARHLIAQVYQATVDTIMPALSRVAGWPADATPAALRLAQQYASDIDLQELTDEVIRRGGLFPPATQRWIIWLQKLRDAGRSANAIVSFVEVLRKVRQAGTLSAAECEKYQATARDCLDRWMKVTVIDAVTSRPSERFVALLQTIGELAVPPGGARRRVSLLYGAADGPVQVLA